MFIVVDKRIFTDEQRAELYEKLKRSSIPDLTYVLKQIRYGVFTAKVMLEYLIAVKENDFTEFNKKYTDKDFKDFYRTVCIHWTFKEVETLLKDKHDLACMIERVIEYLKNGRRQRDFHNKD